MERRENPKSKDLSNRVKQCETEICEELALVNKGEGKWRHIRVCNLVI